jgi:hypothetical protein
MQILTKTHSFFELVTPMGSPEVGAEVLICAPVAARKISVLHHLQVFCVLKLFCLSPPLHYVG